MNTKSCWKHGMEKTQKYCFGVLDKVFPYGKEGLREIVENCHGCHELKACLQAALATTEGLALRCEVLDRAAAKGLAGRLKRWSEKKELSRLIKQKQGQEK